MPRLEQRDLGRLRLLDLDDHLARLEHLLGRVEDGGAGLAEGVVGAIDPDPALVWTNSSCPAATSSITEAGVRPTLNSLFLISFGTPIRIIGSLQA